MNITIAGHVCIDHNNTEHATFTSAGGSAIFMEKIFRLLPDTETTIVSSYGADFLKYKTDIHFYPDKPNTPRTLVYENTIKDNHRTQKAKYRQYAKPVAIDEMLSRILASTDILIVVTLLPNFSSAYVQQLDSFVSSFALKVILPQGYFRTFDASDRVRIREFEEWKKVLSVYDFAIVSNEDHPHMEYLAHSWTTALPNLSVIITQQSKGASLVTKNGSRLVRTIPVPYEEIVSSIGSGDIFSAAFAYKYQTTKNTVQSITYANEIAGHCLKCTPDKISLRQSST